MTAAIVVRVSIEPARNGLLIARSEDLPGFMLTGKTSQQIHKGVPEVIKAMLESTYSTAINVFSAQIGDATNDPRPAWVAVPVPQTL
jgi:hypothetical protein